MSAGKQAKQTGPVLAGTPYQLYLAVCRIGAGLKPGTVYKACLSCRGRRVVYRGETLLDLRDIRALLYRVWTGKQHYLEVEKQA